MKNIDIDFLGVVGSIAVGDCSAYPSGGDSICTVISSEDNIIILDAGSGIRKTEKYFKLAKESKNPIRILLSHIHTDHYVGLPFCPLIYKNELDIEIIGPDNEVGTFFQSLDQALRPPYFPIRIAELKNLKFKSVGPREFEINNIRIIPHELNHPGGALGWKFEFNNGKKIVYVSDNEPIENVSKRISLIEWIKNSDVLIHDGQFSINEYMTHKGWGHSPYNYPIELAKEASVKKVVLYHHNPMRNHEEWIKYQENAEKCAKESEIELNIAKTGLKIRI